MIYKLIHAELFLSAVFCILMLVSLAVGMRRPDYSAPRKAFLIYAAFYFGSVTSLVVTLIVAVVRHWVG